MSHSAPAPAHSTPPLKMGLAIPDSKLCVWLFLGTEIMFFTAFIGTYIVLRMGSPGWPSDPDDTHINVRAGGFNTFVLIGSSYLVVLAHEAMREQNFKKAWNCMAWVLVAGFVFLGIKGFEYRGKFTHDIVPGHIAENDQQALQKLVVECEFSRDSMQAAVLERKAALLSEISDGLSQNRSTQKEEKQKQFDAAIGAIESQLSGFSELSDAASRTGAIMAPYALEALGVQRETDGEAASAEETDDEKQSRETGELLQIGAKAKTLDAFTSDLAALQGFAASLSELKRSVRAETIELEFVGLGVEIKKEAGQGMLLVNVFPDSAAARGGLRRGDRIVQIDGVDIRDQSIDEAASMMRGTAGGAVSVRVTRQSADGQSEDRQWDTTLVRQAENFGTDHELNHEIASFLKTNRDPENGEFVADHFHAHDPHPLPYGNVFASVYFLMTGFHAIHVIVGMILWGIVLAKGKALDGSWNDFVENSGLYWHFVDLVWIFLFPLIYIVQF